MPAFIDGAPESPVRVCDEDPELFESLPPSAMAQARVRAVGRAVGLGRGRWDPGEAGHGDGLGLLLLEGLIVQSVAVDGVPRSELVGPGDVLRPGDGDDAASVACQCRWHVVDPARLVVLDARFVAFACRWPPLMLAVVDRLARRHSRLGVQRAIADQRRVDDRLTLFFWHLADRWGRVCRDGIVLPLPLTHDVLAELVGVQRPSVTSGLQRLAAAGTLRRLPNRTWLLDPEPPVAARNGAG